MKLTRLDKDLKLYPCLACMGKFALNEKGLIVTHFGQGGLICGGSNYPPYKPSEKK